MNDFFIRPAQESDYPKILEIYAFARSFMASHGNPRQWNTKWPPAELVQEDISLHRNFVCVADGRVVGVFVYLYGQDIDPTYRQITDGSWRCDSAYGVVHRLASSGEVRGVGEYCLSWAFAQSGHLRVDTHGDNIVMQNLLKKCGFSYRGIIYVEEDNDPRLAYEKG